MAAEWDGDFERAWQRLLQVWEPLTKEAAVPPLIAPADREHLQGHLDTQENVGVPWTSRLPDDDAKVLECLLRHHADSRRLVLDQLPHPFIGRPFYEKGSKRFVCPVVFLAVNPGLSFFAFRDERVERLLRQDLSGKSAGFSVLSPSLAYPGSGGGLWWRARLASVADYVAGMKPEWLDTGYGTAKQKTIARQLAYRWLAVKACVFDLEWLAYHSKKMPSETEFADLPSVQAALKLARCLAENSDTLFVALVGCKERAASRFGLDLRDLVKSGRIMGGKNAQGWRPKGRDAETIAKRIVAAVGHAG